VAYFALYYSLVDTLGNNAIWLAFISYILIRGILQIIATRRLDISLLMKGYS
jgi:MATE family multidrug resistance protein